MEARSQSFPDLQIAWVKLTLISLIEHGTIYFRMVAFCKDVVVLLALLMLQYTRRLVLS